MVYNVNIYCHIIYEKNIFLKSYNYMLYLYPFLTTRYPMLTYSWYLYNKNINDILGFVWLFDQLIYES